MTLSAAFCGAGERAQPYLRALARRPDVRVTAVCDPDRRALFLRDDREWFSVHVFARGDGEAALVARHFADFGDVKEDPFTGSATGGMAAYCARYGSVRERAYVVHQGMQVHRPGRAEVEIAGEPPDAIGRITVAGSAVTVLRGTLTL